ncbi:hypothetical protein [Enterobacter hormaechei]
MYYRQAFQRAKLGQQAARGGKIHDSRRIKAGELVRLGAGALHQILHQTGEIAF